MPVDLMQDARRGQGLGHYERGRELWSLQSQGQQELRTDFQQGTDGVAAFQSPKMRLLGT